MTWPTVIQWLALVFLFGCAAWSIRNGRRISRAAKAMDGYQRDIKRVAGDIGGLGPRPPVNIQFHLKDGRHIPADAILDRLEWVWQVQTTLTPDEVESMTVDMLPGHSRIEIQRPESPTQL